MGMYTGTLYVAYMNALPYREAEAECILSFLNPGFHFIDLRKVKFQLRVVT